MATGNDVQLDKGGNLLGIKPNETPEISFGGIRNSIRKLVEINYDAPGTGMGENKYKLVLTDVDIFTVMI